MSFHTRHSWLSLNIGVSNYYLTQTDYAQCTHERNIICASYQCEYVYSEIHPCSKTCFQGSWQAKGLEQHKFLKVLIQPTKLLIYIHHNET